MECVVCKNGSTEQGKVTLTLEREGTIAVVKDVPSDICDNCGHCYLSSETAKLVMKQGKVSVTKGAELEIFRLQAA